jgi:hypothetical protein
MIAIKSPRRHFSEQSSPMDESHGPRKSTSMAIKQPFEVWSCFVRKIRRWRQVEVRARRYLNNVVEQDHRAIKQRCASMLGLKSFQSAAVTLAGVELAHRIRKGQHFLPIKLEGRRPSLKEMWECALNPASKAALPDGSCFPPMHQISRRTKRDSSEEFLKSEFPPVRYLRKFSFGGSLNLFLPT